MTVSALYQWGSELCSTFFFFFNGADEMKTAKFGVVAAMTISESGMCIYTASHTRK